MCKRLYSRARRALHRNYLKMLLRSAEVDILHLQADITTAPTRLGGYLAYAEDLRAQIKALEQRP